MSCLALPGAATARDSISPAGGQLLSELGMDERAVRDSLAHDLARGRPDREVQTDES